MSKFDELQQIHQRLLDRLDDAADKAAFAREVQAYISQVCDEAVDVPAPRDRDQLRANLRFWASYVYDATGTYPNTTMRPAGPVGGASTASSATAPPPARAQADTILSVPVSASAPTAPPRAASPGWRTWLVAAIIVVSLVVMYVWVRFNPQGGTPTTSGSIPAIVQPNPETAGQPVVLSWQVITAGPSPFNPNIWVARIELSATGGNGEYIFWVNGQRLPEASNHQFTVESQGCQPVSQFIGATSGGQSVRQELVIQPPEPNSCIQ